MQISFVIPVKNEERSLALTIENIRQTVGDHEYEIIILDDCSQIPATTFLSPSPKLKILRSEISLGASRGPVRAAEVASYDMLCFTEGHVAFEKGWIDQLVQEGIGWRPGVIGIARQDIESFEVFSKCAKREEPPRFKRERYFGMKAKPPPRPDLQFLTRPKSRSLHEIPLAISTCYFVRRSLFFDLGAYEQTFSDFGCLEDTEFCLRVRTFGYPIMMVPNLVCYHWENSEKRKRKNAETAEKYASQYYLGAQENLCRMLYLHFPEKDYFAFIKKFGLEKIDDLVVDEKLKERKVWILQRRVIEAKKLFRPIQWGEWFRRKRVLARKKVILCDSANSFSEKSKDSLYIATSPSVLGELRQLGARNSRLLRWYQDWEAESLSDLHQVFSPQLFSRAGNAVQGLAEIQAQVGHRLDPVFAAVNLLRNIEKAEGVPRVEFRFQDPEIQEQFQLARSVIGDFQLSSPWKMSE